MGVVIFLILVGLAPPVLSVWVSHRAGQRMVNRLHVALSGDHYGALVPRRRNPDERYIDGMGLVIGDITCKLNARSPHIRCAVNPMGPCEGCRTYEGRIYLPMEDMEFS